MPKPASCAATAQHEPFILQYFCVQSEFWCKAARTLAPNPWENIHWSAAKKCLVPGQLNVKVSTNWIIGEIEIWSWCFRLLSRFARIWQNCNNHPMKLSLTRPEREWTTSVQPTSCSSHLFSTNDYCGNQYVTVCIILGKVQVMSSIEVVICETHHWSAFIAVD